MRKMVTRDIFTMSRLITKLDIKDDLKGIIQSKPDADKLDLGIDMILSIMAKVSNKAIEKEIYEFLGSILERPAAEIEEGDPLEIIDTMTKDDGVEQWKDFFKKVTRLIFGRPTSAAEPTEEA